MLLLCFLILHLHGPKDNSSSTASTTAGLIKNRKRLAIGADGSI